MLHDTFVGIHSDDNNDYCTSIAIHIIPNTFWSNINRKIQSALAFVD